MNFKLFLLCLSIGFSAAFSHSANRTGVIQELEKEAKLQFKLLMLFAMAFLTFMMIAARLIRCLLIIGIKAQEYILVVAQDGTELEDLVTTHVMKRIL